MSDIAIKAENLCKRYRIGQSRNRYKTLRDTLAGLVAAPFRRKMSTPSYIQKSISNSTSTSVSGALRSDEIWALRDVSFEVKRGEVVGVIGRNGAGKSTLLKVLSRITEPTEGHAEIHGRVGSLLEVGTGFHPELTGRENIYLNGAILGMRKAEIEGKFEEIVAFADIDKFIDTPIKYYSSGMYVRLAFAVAAHLEPEILLVDEVLAVGDAAFQKKCLSKMGDVAKEGRTVLFVSHNMAAINRLCQRAMWLNEGKKVSDSQVNAVIEGYLQALNRECWSGELLPSRHSINTGEFWIDQVTFANEIGAPIEDLRMGELFTIDMLFKVKLPIQQVRIGVGFNTLDGIRIGTLHHTDGGYKLLDAECGTYKISLNLINPLLPGAYILSVGAHRALGGITIDYVPEALKFHVSEIPANEGMNHEVYNPGLVRFSASWLPPERV
jgi:lipopolysaccharide transport system ATP-binding protein